MGEGVSDQGVPSPVCQMSGYRPCRQVQLAEEMLVAEVVTEGVEACVGYKREVHWKLITLFKPLERFVFLTKERIPCCDVIGLLCLRGLTNVKSDNSS